MRYKGNPKIQSYFPLNFHFRLHVESNAIFQFGLLAGNLYSFTPPEFGIYSQTMIHWCLQDTCLFMQILYFYMDFVNICISTNVNIPIPTKSLCEVPQWFHDGTMVVPWGFIRYYEVPWWFHADSARLYEVLWCFCKVLWGIVRYWAGCVRLCKVLWWFHKVLLGITWSHIVSMMIPWWFCEVCKCSIIVPHWFHEALCNDSMRGFVRHYSTTLFPWWFCNGSGKLFEVLHWGLWGSTMALPYQSNRTVLI